MREALLRSRRRGAPSARVATIPVPAGWDGKNPLAGVSPNHALVLENWFRVFMQGRLLLAVRPGRQDHVTGLGGPIESLMEWAPPSGNPKLFAARQTNIYDVTASGAVGAAVQSSLTNGRWQHTNFSTSAGNFLYMVNGADAPRYYDGTSWTQPVISGSGLTVTNLIGIQSHMNRLWFVESGTRKAWYLPVQSIAGTLTAFDMSSLTRRGGQLTAIGTWTRDGGSGSDDYGVFVFSTGEVLVYAGTDPAANTTWGLVGRFKLAEPVGRRCILNLGGELVILTSQGPIPLSQAMGLSIAGQANTALTDEITGAFQDAYSRTGSQFGWEVIEWPRAGMFFVNVPTRERVSQEQYVFSTRGGGWHKFTGFNAGCWATMGSDLYYGDNSGTVHHITGFSDAGSPIVATYQHAFTNLNTPLLKNVGAAKPRLLAPSGYTPLVQIKTNFDITPLQTQALLAEGTGSAWDADYWDEATWGDESVATEDWQVVEGEGSTISVAFKVSTTAPVAYEGTDLSYTVGGLM